MATKSPRVSLRMRVLREIFGLLYRNRYLYWFASTVPFAGQWRVWQRLTLPRIRGARVLEIGCGPGKLLADMVRAGYTCAAVDHSPQMVAAARDELKRQGLPETPITQGDVQHLPYLGESFDTVVSTFPTEYIYEPASLREVARVLRPGGRLVVVMGAGLLPTRVVLLPLVGLARLIYGPSAPSSGHSCAAATATQTTQLPLDAAGLVGKPQCVRGPFWEAYLVVAEKPDTLAHP